MKTFALKLSVYSLNNQKHFFKLTSPVNKFSDFPKDSLYLYIYSPKDVFCINSHFCATIKFFTKLVDFRRKCIPVSRTATGSRKTLLSLLLKDTVSRGISSPGRAAALC